MRTYKFRIESICYPYEQKIVEIKETCFHNAYCDLMELYYFYDFICRVLK